MAVRVGNGRRSQAAPSTFAAAAPGTLVWLGLLVGRLLGADHLSIVDFWLTFGVAFVVPLGLAQLWTLGLRLPPATLLGCAGALCVFSFTLRRGPLAGALATPWLVLALVAAAMGIVWLIQARSLDVRQLLIAAAPCYLAFGAAWLVASRLGLRPMNFDSRIVELTGVHFHFAGFAAPLLALATGEFLESRSERQARAALFAGLGVVAAMPVVAGGFVLGRWVSSLGATMLAVSLWGLAALMLPASGALRQPAKALLRLAAVSVSVAMVIALEYTAGPLLGLATLSITRMAQIHGTANAVGFTGAAMLAFALAPMGSRAGRPNP